MNHAISKIDEDTELLNLLGMIYFELGDVNNAIKNFMKVLRINPSDGEAKEGLLLCNSIKN
ncbi:MAG TPA: tetratricopeptide repeat protein [Ignavibacteria bacterium]|nr:tetratricopeptide repeat protein [Ignavibacteria bacterium]